MPRKGITVTEESISGRNQKFRDNHTGEKMSRTQFVKKIEHVELSWVLEDNKPMRHILESLGAESYKTYRLYEKSLQ